MKKLLGVLGLLLLFAATAAAQGPKLEVYGGPSFLLYTQPSGVHLKMLGGTASADYYVFHWLSGQFEATGTYNSYGAYGSAYGGSSSGPSSPTTIYSAMLGPMIFPLGHRRLTPFVHFLFGAAYYDHQYAAFGGFPAASYTNLSYSWETGGGIDLTVKKHWAVRILQADFGQVNFAVSTSGAQKQSTYRATVGVIYRFGAK